MKYDITGYNVEELLLKLYSKKLKLYDIKKYDYKHISFRLENKNHNKVKKYLANYQVIITKQGIKNLPKLILSQIGILLGVFVGIIFGIFFSSYTWQIEIYGTKNLTNTEILSVLKNNGIKTGKINLISSEEIESILLNNYERLAQVSVIKKGTAIIINLSEKLVYEEIEYNPILANSCGIITNLNVITGTINVKVGDYVNVGDILVLPFNVDSAGKKVSVKPIADIKATIFSITKTEINKHEQILVNSGKTQKVYRYKLFNFNLFFGKNKNSFALFSVDSYNENISDLVPFSRQVFVYHELVPKQIENDLTTAKQTIIDENETQAKLKLPSGAEIIDIDSSLQTSEEKLVAYTTLTYIGSING